MSYDTRSSYEDDVYLWTVENYKERNDEIRREKLEAEYKEEEEARKLLKEKQTTLDTVLIRQQQLQEELLRELDASLDKRLETRLDALEKLMDDLGDLFYISPTKGPKAEKTETRLDDLIDKVTQLKEWLSTPVKEDVNLKSF